MKRLKTVSRFLAFALVSVGLLAYQNCSAPISSGLKSEDAMAASLPFAYDAQVDQLAYMSCSELASGYDASQYFMFRAGAYGANAGLSLSTEFLNKTIGGYTAQRSALLDNGTMNAGTKVLFAMRAASDFESTYPGSTVGVDWSPVFSNLGLPESSDKLVAAAATSTKLRYLSTGLLPGARFEGDLGGSQGANPYQQYRTYFNSSTLLFGVNFMSEAGKAFARAPADYPSTGSTLAAKQSVYGRGLYLTFARPSVAGLAPTAPDYVLSTVREYDMQNRSYTSNTWTCPTNLQFRIVRAEDLARPNVNCTVKPDSQNANQALLKYARNSLRAEDWYVNADQGCIVPKKLTGPQCYGSLPNLHVQYDQTGACSAPATTGGTDVSTGITTNATCVHYASLCYRTN
jgi:hypothetical protein